jgi:hypothetical protein
MAKRIFNLRDVPDDEAEEICRLLDEQGMDYYETPPGRWGLSAPALWVRDDADHERARDLIARYQHERAARARREYQERKAAGQHATLWDALRHHPVRFVAVLLGIAFVVYVSVGPFMKWVAR